MDGDHEVIANFAAQQRLPAAFASDARQYFVPVADWLAAGQRDDGPLVVGLNGAQGSGKTTLSRLVAELLQGRGLRPLLLSLDDFYLPRADRAQLAANVHPLLATRGVPGTHDIAALSDCLERQRNAVAQTVTEWPAFDKANDERKPEAQQFRGAADVVLVEGWCVGVGAQSNAALADPVNELERTDDADARWRRYVNEQLRDAYRRAFSSLDRLCFLQVPDFAAVERWRWQQEQELAASRRGDALMTRTSLQRFLQHFERLTRHALREMPGRADWLLLLDDQHRCVRSGPRPY